MDDIISAWNQSRRRALNTTLNKKPGSAYAFYEELFIPAHYKIAIRSDQLEASSADAVEEWTEFCSSCMVGLQRGLGRAKAAAIAARVR